MTVELTEAEWNQAINILAQAPWNVANPLLVRITQQLQVQKSATAFVAAASDDGLDPAAKERH
jgi:hypothetical protein